MKEIQSDIEGGRVIVPFHAYEDLPKEKRMECPQYFLNSGWQSTQKEAFDKFWSEYHRFDYPDGILFWHDYPRLFREQNVNSEIIYAIRCSFIIQPIPEKEPQSLNSNKNLLIETPYG